MSQTDLDRPERPTATDALAQHGLNGERVLKLARRIANDAQRRAPAGLGGKYEDLVSFLTLQALEAAVRYNPDRVRPGYTFSSYICDIMEHRVQDFYRRKSEGFGDRRYGNDARIVLADDTDTITIDTDLDFEALVSERRAATWNRAAELLDLTFAEWVVQTLDTAARDVPGAAARPKSARPATTENVSYRHESGIVRRAA